MVLKIVFFFQSLIDATIDPGKGTGAEIVIVISNKPGVQGLIRAKNANIPTKANMMFFLILMFLLLYF